MSYGSKSGPVFMDLSQWFKSLPKTFSMANSLNVLNPGSIDQYGNDSTGPRVIAT